jgi:DNA ligase (NAD+)
MNKKFNTHADLIDFLKEASMAYYTGEPFISDVEFDSLAKMADYKEVGSTSIDNRISHLSRMYSLQKVFENEHTNKNPLSDYKGKVVWTPKLDGAAVSLTYFRGKLINALTRGDGRKGIDITNNMEHLVPKEYDFFKVHPDPFGPERPYTQITGEVVAPKHIKNARNYAAGALNLKDYGEFIMREIEFIAYDIQPKNELLWSEEMANLKKVHFRTILDSEYHEFPTDGMVCRIDNQLDFEKKGYTSHHPRGAYALKRIQKGVHTTLIDVIWQVGKSGVVSPVGILSPVEIDGAMISKATLHNIKYIESLNLEIGCRVEVIRSGEIIPRIVRRVW